jgi:hypothetical protein
LKTYNSCLPERKKTAITFNLAKHKKQAEIFAYTHLAQLKRHRQNNSAVRCNYRAAELFVIVMGINQNFTLFLPKYACKLFKTHL